MYTFYSQISTRTDRKSMTKRAGCSKNPLFFVLKISFIQWGINETITRLSWKFEENRTSGRFYFFKQKKEHNKWNPLYWKNLHHLHFMQSSSHYLTDWLPWCKETMSNLMRIRNKEKLEKKLSKFVPFFRTHLLHWSDCANLQAEL